MGLAGNYSPQFLALVKSKGAIRGLLVYYTPGAPGTNNPKFLALVNSIGTIRGIYMINIQ